VIPAYAARSLRLPGYLVMAMLMVFSAGEVGVRSSPFRVHSPAWRLELIGSGAGAMGTVVLGLFVIYAIAAAADDRPTAYIVSSLSSLAAALCVIAIGVFSLDAIQVKTQVQSSLAHGYDVGTVWVAVRLAIAAIVLAVIAVSSIRAARSARREASPRTSGPRAAVLVTTPRGAGAAVSPGPPGAPGKR
jgi:hypothetical protein